MDVVVRRMDFPKDCLGCRLCLHTNRGLFCAGLQKYIGIICGKRQPSCPLDPLYEHGRLIDADKLNYKTVQFYHKELQRSGVPHKVIEDVDIHQAPTVLPSSHLQVRNDCNSIIDIAKAKGIWIEDGEKNE